MNLYEKIIDLLQKSQVWYEVLEHEPVFTSAEAARTRQDISLHQGAKAMVVKIRNPKGEIRDPFVMIVCPGDLKIDFKKVRKFLFSADATLARPEEVEARVGVKIGAVSPFGHLSNLPVLVDRSLSDNEIIAFNAGDHRRSVKMKTADFLRLGQFPLDDFTQSS